MKELWKKYKGPILYLVFGGVTTVVNIVTYALCYKGVDIPGVVRIGGLGIPNVPSNVIAWVLSVAVAYITNKLWVFESKSFDAKVLWPELGKFVSARLVTLVLDTAIMWVGVDLLGGPELIVKIGSNVVVVVLNYVFSKLLIFKHKEDTAG